MANLKYFATYLLMSGTVCPQQLQLRSIEQ